MNPVFHQAAENTDMGWFLGVMTILFFSFFLFWTWWVFHPANRAQMDAAAQLPLEDDDAPPGGAR